MNLRFERILAVLDNADINSIYATMDKGLLTITIARKELIETKAKKERLASLTARHFVKHGNVNFVRYSFSLPNISITMCRIDIKKVYNFYFNLHS